ncbi:putative glucose-6-phosphate dehydrogenase-6-phosphogluconolactonase [Paratrimastix pyriformis]|uniref:Glucose-6-phosphate dehydrogenase-6-phosphogluconolactonase n=1 Tax=Paratrimastix pyriformis TaxID=342808 RepID=A0ABQ8UUP8_9EUKA|nr:putative glucose-6-phosphate dehydrogenase-6-phosphogluconolactonase [Paratrimastix pyriformis]
MDGCIRTHGECILGLSGGSTPRKVYETLGASAPSFDWSKVTVFLVDERITTNPADMNAQLVRDSLLKEMTPRTPARVIFPSTSLDSSGCVRDYNQRLVPLEGKTDRMVLVLGMGPDGHIASLFPPVDTALVTAAARNQESIHTEAPAQFAVHDRITITTWLCRAAHRIFLTKGRDKKALWDAMLASPEGPERWPAKMVLGPQCTVVHCLE